MHSHRDADCVLRLMQHSDSTTRPVGELWSPFNEQSPLLFRARSRVVSLLVVSYWHVRAVHHRRHQYGEQLR